MRLDEARGKIRYSCGDPGRLPERAVKFEAEHGIAHALARNLAGMSNLPTPIVSVIIGQGGSGGALALGVADRVLILEHAI